MSFNFGVVSCCLFLCIVAIRTIAATNQVVDSDRGIVKQQSKSSGPSLKGFLSLNVKDSQKPHHPARSSLGVPNIFSNRNENAFWALRGKRPHIVSSNTQEDVTHPTEFSKDKQTENTSEEDNHTKEKVIEINETENNTEDKESDDEVLWPSEYDDMDQSNDEPYEVVFSTPKRNTPYWVSRGKKGISDYIPFYWGSNQNVLGKVPLSGMPMTTVVHNIDRPSKLLHSSPVSGWESNQSFWGKRNENRPLLTFHGRQEDNGPYWVTRGKKQNQDDESSYWIARGKKPSNFEKNWGSNPMLLGKRDNKVETSEGSSDQDVREPVETKRANNSPFWVSRGKKSPSQTTDEHSTFPFWLSRGRRSQNNTFWVTRGKKDDVTKPFWIARGKKDLNDKNPFWVARGKKADSDSAQAFWVARGKKEDSDTSFWVARGKKEEEKPTFWVARGKKNAGKIPLWIARGKKENEGTPFWVARGKKDKDQSPFWVSRGKKEKEPVNTFWVARGKKDHDDDHLFWITARGKKDKDHTSYMLPKEEEQDSDSSFNNPFWVSRGKRVSGKNPNWITRAEMEEDNTPYWIARGKKTGSDNPYWIARGRKSVPEDDESDDLFWISRGRRAFWTATEKQHGHKVGHNLLMNYIKEAILGQQKQNEIQGFTGKQGSSLTDDPLH